MREGLRCIFFHGLDITLIFYGVSSVNCSFTSTAIKRCSFPGDRTRYVVRRFAAVTGSLARHFFRGSSLKQISFHANLLCCSLSMGLLLLSSPLFRWSSEAARRGSPRSRRRPKSLDASNDLWPDTYLARERQNLHRPRLVADGP